MREALAFDERRGIVLAGLAGVGKTRLARAAADAAAQAGHVVRRVAGTASGRTVTLGAFARWVEDTDPSPVAMARKVFAGLTAEADGAPLLLFVDDAHLLDDLSALVVHQLVLHDMAGVIATIRTGEPAPDPVTALWKDGLLRRLELQPLSRAESDRLLRAALDGPLAPIVADRMWRLGRGNALFLHHLVEHERDSGRLTNVDGEWRWAGTPSASPSLIELVGQQIGAVPDDVREVVDLVAIAEPVGREILLTLADRQTIEAAEERHLIRIGSDTVVVGHPLYSDIRLSQASPMRLERLRGRVATAMVETTSSDPLQVGMLWLESDLPPDADVFLRAAKVAASRLDPRLAERLCRAAVSACEGRAEASLMLAHTLFLQDQGQAALDVLDRLESHQLTVPGYLDGELQRAANLMWPLRRPDDARRLLDDALTRADDQRTPSLQTFRAVAHVMAAEPAEAVRTMEAVAFDRLDSFVQVIAHTAETIAHGDLGRARDATRSASAGYRVLADSPHDTFDGTGLPEFHAYALLVAGHVDEAVVVADREQHRCAGSTGMSRWISDAALGMTALGSGDLAASLRHFRSATDGFGDHDDTGGVLYRIRIPHTEALARSGDVVGSIESLDATTRIRHPTWDFVQPAYLLASAWVSAARGRVSQACEIASSAADFARTHGQLAREVLCLQTSVQFGDPSGACRLDELAARVEGPRAPLAARYARSLADRDGDGLDAVSRDFESMGDRLTAADAAAHAATSHREAGSRGRAMTAAARARCLATDCGHAVSPALAASDMPLPLTRREHEIASLLANGLSNRQIAEATSLSVRTVEGHLYQASAKAGVSSRAELTALMRQSRTTAQPATG